MLYHKLEQKAQPEFLKTNRVIETFKKKKIGWGKRQKNRQAHVYDMYTISVC